MSRTRSRQLPPLEYAASVHPGLEEVTEDEIGSVLRGAQSVAKTRGWIVFRYPGDAGALLRLRTTEDVFVLLYRTDKLPSNRSGAMPLLTRMARDSYHWEQAMTSLYQTRRSVKRVTYRVIAQMSGQLGFRRHEIGDAVITGIQARWPRWKPVVEDAHVEVWAIVQGAWAAIGLRLSSRRMRHRAYKTDHRPASLRPSLAAAMVQLSQPRPGDRFCDPMCGAGTILAERALHGPFGELVGGDMDPDALQAAAANLMHVPAVGRAQVLHLWDARALPFRSLSLDVIVSNLPFGVQVGTHTDNVALYTRFFREMARCLRPGGRAVLLSGEKALVRDLLRDTPALRREREILIGVLGQAARIYVLRRRSEDAQQEP
ncbi:MAG: RNA methyltransferase [Anaerolineae bacterium]|nr:RNA methyltransferase [Anaerolineae bacterium]